ncbi:MAG: chorismate lyase [Betaproteobacteria bacterium]|nr:chorismate lyase [Betaproteobacteria bacterium]
MRTLRLTTIDAWRATPPAHPHPLHVWLTDRGSLTARLIHHTRCFNLVRLMQREQLPNRDERRHLGLRQGELAIVREVLLRDGDTAQVFGHSLVAQRDLTGAWRGLGRLGARPLADMLFHDPTVVRLPMEYRKIDRRHPLYQRIASLNLPLPTTLWARRSIFLKRGRPLLVTEVFLREPGGGPTLP